MLAPLETSPDCQGVLELPASQGSTQRHQPERALPRRLAMVEGRVAAQASLGHLVFGPTKAFSPWTRKSDTRVQRVLCPLVLRGVLGGRQRPGA